MLERIFRVLTGFVMACLAAGFTKALFAITPAELYNLPADVQGDRLTRLFESGLFASIWSAVFTFPFALVAAAIAEWRRIRSWTYYAMIALAVSLIGFMTQHSSEVAGQPSILNNYGLTAFITSGFMAGLVYWLFGGRLAGGPAPAPLTAARVETRDTRPANSPATRPPPKSGTQKA